MPEKYVRREGLPILVRHTGRTTLPQDPPPMGDGAHVVCLHDAGLQSSVFAALLPAVAPDGGAIAFDLPGHGRSGSLDALPSIAAMTELAQWVADWCGARRPLLVGHGMGALIALEWMRQRPDDVVGLVLCGAGLAFGIENEAIETMRRVTEGKAPRPFDPARVCPEGGREMMQKAYMEGLGTDPRATLVDLEASREWTEAWEGSDAAELPARVVCGAAEPAPCRARAEQLARALASEPAVEIDGAAHFLPLERPSELAREIRHVAEAR